MLCLNLGCGQRFHPDWVNVDFVSSGEGVIVADLSKGIPFPDGYFDVVYHSHLLEHFSSMDAVGFIKECYRVLRPKGVLRIAVPDLEGIASTYLMVLEKAMAGSEEWEANYDWILLEMYDQTVRNTSGGDMKCFLSQECLPNEEFVIARCGVEASRLIEAGKQSRQSGAFRPVDSHSGGLLLLLRKCLSKSFWHEKLRRLLLGKEGYKAFQIGRFRLSGEVHQWMYDRYSLRRLIEKAGFIDVAQMTADKSQIDNWIMYHLDMEADGEIYKPDSIYVEAMKP